MKSGRARDMDPGGQAKGSGRVIICCVTRSTDCVTSRDRRAGRAGRAARWARGTHRYCNKPALRCCAMKLLYKRQCNAVPCLDRYLQTFPSPCLWPSCLFSESTKLLIRVNLLRYSVPERWAKGPQSDYLSCTTINCNDLLKNLNQWYIIHVTCDTLSCRQKQVFQVIIVI